MWLFVLSRSSDSPTYFHNATQEALIVRGGACELTDKDERLVLLEMSKYYQLSPNFLSWRWLDKVLDCSDRPKSKRSIVNVLTKFRWKKSEFEAENRFLFSMCLLLLYSIHFLRNLRYSRFRFTLSRDVTMTTLQPFTQSPSTRFTLTLTVRTSRLLQHFTAVWVQWNLFSVSLLTWINRSNKKEIRKKLKKEVKYF